MLACRHQWKSSCLSQAVSGSAEYAELLTVAMQLVNDMFSSALQYYELAQQANQFSAGSSCLQNAACVHMQQQAQQINQTMHLADWQSYHTCTRATSHIRHHTVDTTQWHIFVLLTQFQNVGKHGIRPRSDATKGQTTLV